MIGPHQVFGWVEPANPRARLICAGVTTSFARKLNAATKLAHNPYRSDTETHCECVDDEITKARMPTRHEELRKLNATREDY